MPTDYSGWGGLGYRVGLVVCTHTGYSGGGATLNGFDTDRAINGNFSNGGAGSWFFPSVPNVGSGGNSLRFDFQAPVIITEFKWYQDSAATQAFYDWEGSNDGSTWTTIQANFLLGHISNNPAVHTFSNSVAYRYYRLNGVSGGSNSGPWQQETEFKADHYTAFETGDRTASITVTIGGLTLAGGTASNLVDGLLGNTDSDAIRFTDAQVVSGTSTIELDWGGASYTLNAMGVMCLDGGVGAVGGFNDSGIWKAQAYVSGVWQDFGSSFTMGSVLTHVQTDTPVTCTKVRYLGVSGATSDDLRVNEIFLNLGPAGAPDPELLEIAFEDEAEFFAALAAAFAISFTDDNEAGDEFAVTITIDPVAALLAADFVDEGQFYVRESHEPVAIVQAIIIAGGR